MKSQSRVKFSRVTVNRVEVVIGRGTTEDPIRVVTHWYEDDGREIVMDDPVADDEEPEPQS